MGELKKKFSSLSIQRLYQIIDETKKKYRIIERDIAAYALAYDNDIRIERWLEPATVAKVQTAIHRSPTPLPAEKKEKKSKSPSLAMIKFASDFKLNESILPRKITQEALKMAQ